MPTPEEFEALPYRYLTALLTELPKAKTVDDFEALLPWRITLIERRATPR